MILDKLNAQGLRITSVTDKLHVIHGSNRGRSPFCNSFLVLDRMNILNFMELARRNAITASELCQIRNEAALSLTGYVTLLVVALQLWNFAIAINFAVDVF